MNLNKLSELELIVLFEALYRMSVSDDTDIDTFKSDNNLTDDEFDELTINLRTKIDRELTKLGFNRDE